MAGKARVHELAKELGVTSKQVLARLNEQGEFVKSASSTVEAPVARRLRESFGGSKPAAAVTIPVNRKGYPSANRNMAAHNKYSELPTEIANSSRLEKYSSHPRQNALLSPTAFTILPVSMADANDGAYAVKNSKPICTMLSP